MWKIGFGFERVGLLALRFPILFSLALICLTAFTAFNASTLKFNGNILAVLPKSSPVVDQYYKTLSDYRNFSRDVTILVEAENLASVVGLDALRDLQLELSLVEGVGSVSSILSVPDFDPETGDYKDWFPLEITSDAEAKSLLTTLVAKYPQVKSLYSEKRKVAVLIAGLDIGIQDDDVASINSFYALKAAALKAVPENFKVSFTGLTPIGATIKKALVSDQIKLTVFGILLGAGISFLIFRNFLAALICAMPPIFTALWSIGLFAYFGVQVTFLTTVLPILALILAFADGVFLYFRWRTSNSENTDLIGNLRNSIIRVGPACALTSITTALAFLSFHYVQSDVLDQFAIMGAGVVLLAFVAVIIGMPLVLYWFVKVGIIKPVQTPRPSFQNFGKNWRVISLSRPVLISAIGLLLVFALGSVHNLIKPEYIVTDYVPKQEEVYYAETLANDVIGGRSMLLVSVPFADDDGFSSKVNRTRLSDVEGILIQRFDADRVLSANSVLKTIKNEVALKKITDLIKSGESGTRSQLLSRDGMSALISVRTASDASVSQVAEDISWINDKIQSLPYGNLVTISGFPVLMSSEFTGLINHLRSSLIIAIFLGILIVGIATRSLFIAIAAITPNLLPVFAVQFILYLKGGTLNLAEVISLIIAFGIAIDNAVHLINVYHEEKSYGKETRHALSAALDEVGPALAAGTVIICTSILVTQISVLPVAPALGQLIIVTLSVALFANITILPANILTLEYIIKWWNKK
ncbi:MAG: MMPL family transporter [Rhizobiales bacterium]|nr:MMPL family transporter [Hyphomicrobiales bacterium]